MPSEERGDQVGEAEEIKSPGENGACNPVESGSIPSYLRAIDGEMGRDGTTKPLLDKDLIGIFEVDILRSGVSAEDVVSQGPESKFGEGF